MDQSQFPPPPRHDFSLDLHLAPMSLQEWHRLPASVLPHELLNGHLFLHHPPHSRHTRHVMHVQRYLYERVSYGEWWMMPLDIILNSHNVVQPDVFWLPPGSNCYEMDNGYLYGAPEFVVEIIDEPRHDLEWTIKLDLYQYYGVREYWIIDPLAHTVDVFVNGAQGFFRQGVFGLMQRFPSVMLRVTIRVSQLFPNDWSAKKITSQ